ncbi:MAG: hypothetical protein OJF55_000154 [Rhodanobacteraceae bacterium]|jgi:hypothetical protein|nr:MAG: hypothetical protein OJF55_000154 [Rhodanobacteraceae bacterium]
MLISSAIHARRFDSCPATAITALKQDIRKPAAQTTSGRWTLEQRRDPQDGFSSRAVVRARFFRTYG